MMIVHDVYNPEENFMLLFKHLVESKGLNSMILFNESETKRSQRAKVDESVLGLLRSIYQNVSEGQQKHYDEAIEELREEVRGCRKEFGLLQELFIQAIKARLNPDCGEMDAGLLKELQALMKKGEWAIVRRELAALLEKEVAFEGEEEMMQSEEFSFAFNMKRPPTSAAQVAGFGSERCQKCSASRHAMCLLCGWVVCSQCAPKHREEKHQGSWVALVFGKKQLEVQAKEKDKKHLYFNAFMMPYEMKREDEKEEDFQLNEELFDKAVGEFLNWH